MCVLSVCRSQSIIMVWNLSWKKRWWRELARIRSEPRSIPPPMQMSLQRSFQRPKSVLHRGPDRSLSKCTISDLSSGQRKLTN